MIKGINELNNIFIKDTYYYVESAKAADRLPEMNTLDIATLEHGSDLIVDGNLYLGLNCELTISGKVDCVSIQLLNDDYT